MLSAEQKLEKTLWEKVSDAFMMVIALCLVGFHLYAASFGALIPYLQTSVHWALVGSFIVLAKPLKFPGGRIIDILFILLNIFFSYYLLLVQDRPMHMVGIFSQLDVIVSIGATVLALLIAFRVVGPILPLICIVFIAYGLFGHLLAGILHTSRFSVMRLFTTFYANVSMGLYGQTLFVSAQFIFLFVLFGSLLEVTGVGSFFVDLAFSLTGKTRGGPAQAAVISTMLVGTINGSGAANVVTTGHFTIPLMKKVGYKSSMAGAIEATASAWGQLMPPVMGAVAFLMSEVTGIPFASIALAALIPSLLCFASVAMVVYLTARRDNIPVARNDQLKKTWQVLKSGWLYFSPLITLIAMLTYGYSVRRAAFFAILVTIAVGFIKNRQNMTLEKLSKAVRNSASGIAPIAAACILAGIIMTVLNITGLGLRVSTIIVSLAGDNLLPGLVLAMITSLVLGMGLPTSAAYMILAVVVAPAMVRMGASLMSAHMFILYFAALSTITPPVPLSVFAAAGIAKAGMWTTARDAVFLASTGFIIPFAFVYQSALLMDGAPLVVIASVLRALVGCAILGSAVAGWMGIRLNILARLALFSCAILLFVPEPIILNFAGVAAAAIIVVILNFASKLKGVK